MSETNASATQQQQFQIQKIFVKDISLETPNSPQIFQDHQNQWNPQINLQIHTDFKQLGETVYEDILTVTVTAAFGEKTAFLIELQQAGVFTLKNFPQEQLGPMLGAMCPTILFPYAREAIDNLLIKAGFPPLQLAPVNFDAIYAQRMQAEREQEAATATAH